MSNIQINCSHWLFYHVHHSSLGLIVTHQLDLILHETKSSLHQQDSVGQGFQLLVCTSQLSEHLTVVIVIVLLVVQL